MTANQMCRRRETCDNTLKETTVNSPQRAAARFAARACGALAIATTVLLAGCQNFFLCQKASCPSSGSGSGSTTSDFAYVSNGTSGSTYVAGYDLSNGSLAAISGSPYNLTFVPVAMTVSPNDTFLYAATLAGVTNPGIYLFSINSSGQLSSAYNGDVLASAAVSSMDISPDGGFLFALNTSGNLLTEYQTNTSTGVLTPATSFPLPGVTCTLAGNTVVSQTCTVKVAPGGDFVVVSLGTAGTAIFPYTSASGITTPNYTLIGSGSTTASPTGDYSVALDSSNNIYIARTAALAVYQITDAAGDAGLKSSAGINSSYVPRSVVLSSTYDYVYTANEGTGTVSAYSIGSSGALTAVSGSPFSGPTNVSALGVDKSGSYMVTAGYNSSSGVQLFSIGSTGALSLVTSAGNGTSTAYPVVLAMSH
jgi:6-phosphogluconolactonase (cycloisomerase 2 family)